MSETTFGVLFALCCVLLTGVLLMIIRFNQRFTEPSSNNQHWILSGQLRAGRWLLIVGGFLMLTGFLIGDTRFIPIAVPA